MQKSARTLLSSRQAHRVHRSAIRPRAFPLGLRAPCHWYGAYSSPCRLQAAGSGAASNWGEEGILSPARSPPRIALLMCIVAPTCRGSTNLYGSHERAFGVRPSHNPSPRLHPCVYILAQHLSSCLRLTGRSPKGVALAEMPEARNSRACPTRRARTKHAASKLQMLAALPKHKFKLSRIRLLFPSFRLF